MKLKKAHGEKVECINKQGKRGREHVINPKPKCKPPLKVEKVCDNVFSSIKDALVHKANDHSQKTVDDNSKKNVLEEPMCKN